MAKVKKNTITTEILEYSIILLVSYFVSRFMPYYYIIAHILLLSIYEDKHNFLIIAFIGIIISLTSLPYMDKLLCLAEGSVFLAFVFIRRMTIKVNGLFESIGAFCLCVTYYIFNQVSIAVLATIFIQSLAIIPIGKLAKLGVNKLLSCEGRWIQGGRTSFENASILIIIFLISASLIGICIGGIPIYYLVVPFALMCIFTFLGSSIGSFVGVFIGLGSAFGKQDLNLLLYSLILILAMSFFWDYRRVFGVFGVFAINLLSVLYFEIIPSSIIITAILSTISILLYLLIPSSLIKRHFLISGGRERELSKFMVNYGRKISAIKLGQLKYIYGKLGENLSAKKAEIDINRVCKSCVKGVRNEVCKTCEKKSICIDQMGDKIDDEISVITKSGLTRGNANLLDLTQYMSKNCQKVQEVLKVINKETGIAIIKNQNEHILDRTKVLLSNNCIGISQSLDKIESELCENITFTPQIGERLREAFTALGIEYDEVFTYIEDKSTPKAVISLKKNTKLTKKIVKIVSDIFAVNMTGVVHSSCEGRSLKNLGGKIVTFSPSPNFMITYGEAGAKKPSSQLSGDTHSIAHISSSKFMVALCDGMGSGKMAREISERGVELVELLYKAGFEEDVVATITNNLLSQSVDSEVFVAMDIAVVNLIDGQCDFIKLGATSSYILSNEITEVCGEGLPLGIVDVITPLKVTKKVGNGDFIIMTSDGIADAIGTKMQAVLSKKVYYNPQVLADDILDYATEQIKGDSKQDDMSVVVLRVMLEKNT